MIIEEIKKIIFIQTQIKMEIFCLLSKLIFQQKFIHNIALYFIFYLKLNNNIGNLIIILYLNI